MHDIASIEHVMSILYMIILKIYLYAIYIHVINMFLFVVLTIFVIYNIHCKITDSTVQKNRPESLLHTGGHLDPGRAKQILVDPKIGFSKNMAKPPKSSILIGFSIIFTIHFGIPLFLETPKCCGSVFPKKSVSDIYLYIK